MTTDYSGSILGEVEDWKVGKYRHDLDIYGLQEELGNRLNREMKLQYELNTDFTFEHFRQAQRELSPNKARLPHLGDEPDWHAAGY